MPFPCPCHVHVPWRCGSSDALQTSVTLSIRPWGCSSRELCMQFEPPPLRPPQPPQRQRRGRERLLPLVLLLAVLAAWYGLVQWRRLPPLVLPLPTAVARVLVQNLLDGFLWPHLWVTLSEIVLGFVGGSALGVGLGSLVALAPLVQRILNPYIIASQAMPKLALPPLFFLSSSFSITPTPLLSPL